MGVRSGGGDSAGYLYFGPRPLRFGLRPDAHRPRPVVGRTGAGAPEDSIERPLFEPCRDQLQDPGDMS